MRITILQITINNIHRILAKNQHFMENITLRKANRSDLYNIRQLVVELAVFEKEPNAVVATLENYQNAFDSNLIKSIIAEDESVTIGMTLFYDTFSTWRGKMLYLEDFYVKSDYRSKGVGSALFKAVINEAQATDCKMMKWQVLDWNKGAIDFYEDKGATIEREWYNGKIIF